MRRSGRRQRRNRSSATSAGRSGLRLRAFAEVLFDEDLHAKRVESLANGVAGVLNAAMLTIHAIRRAYAAVASIEARSGVKQIGMLLSNVGVVLEVLFPSWLCAYASRGTADHDPSSRTCAKEFWLAADLSDAVEHIDTLVEVLERELARDDLLQLGARDKAPAAVALVTQE